MLLKNVSGQGVFLYAYTVSTGLAKTGDAANITGYYSLDGGTDTVFATANPTEISAANMAGVYWQPLSQAGTNGNQIAYCWKSATSGVAIAPLLVSTTGANIPVAALNLSGGFLTVGTSAGQLTPAAGGVDVQTVLGTTPASDASITSAVWTTALTESYNVDGVAPTPAQALFGILQRLTEFAISGTTITVKKLDGSTAAMTLTMDSSTSPTSSTRTA